MRYWGATKTDIKENLLKLTAFLTAGFVGMGVLMWLSLSYTAQGSKVILIGAAVGFIGWFLTGVLPHFMKYYEVLCPSCLTRHEVSNSAAKFQCGNCGERLFGKEYWRTQASMRRRTKVRTDCETKGIVSFMTQANYKEG